jgi:transposase
MFVRIKTTPNSPRKSVQIVKSVRKADKISQKIVRHVGIAMDEDELQKMLILAEAIKIKLEQGDQGLLFPPEEIAKSNLKARKERKKLGKDQKKIYTDKDYEVNVKDIREESRVISGIHDVYGNLFEELGYEKVISQSARNRSAVGLLRDVVLARIANPVSKKSTVEMLENNFGITLKLDSVYRMMDKLDDKAIEKLNEITYRNTLDLFEDRKLDVIFFDCTTIYFESFTEDEFKKNGYSKDLKFNQPQVLLALMVTKEGLPLGYQAFEGNKYEGHTLMEALKVLKGKYNLDKVVFVADSGLTNKDNLRELELNNFDYIVGSRLKNLPQEIKEQVLDHNNYREIDQDDKSDFIKIASFDHSFGKIVVSYSKRRAIKDAKDREKALKKLRAKLSKIKNPKEYLSNYGYKKFLKVSGNSKIEIDEKKILEQSQWDGLHGVITNSKNLGDREILGQYHNLWQVENAFRVTKHDLKVRPVFHWKPSRVKAHLAISFISYALVKYLEYRVRLQYKKLSPEIIRKSLVGVQTSINYNKVKRIRYGFPSSISQEAKKIYQVMGLKRNLTPYIIKKY